jgi:regulatory protein
MKKAARPELSLKARALRWLAQREHSPAELQRKLLAAVRRQAALHVVEAGVADRVDAAVAAAQAAWPALLAELQAAGHLSAERFVESRLNLRSRRFGQQRISSELRQHGLALSAQQSESLAVSESERALAVFMKRFGRSGGLAPDAAGRAKQMRFLAARGFDGHAIREALKRAAAAPGSDDSAG